jgi:hypothetical protein
VFLFAALRKRRVKQFGMARQIGRDNIANPKSSTGSKVSDKRVHSEMLLLDYRIADHDECWLAGFKDARHFPKTFFQICDPLGWLLF